jgi:2',3'-cyclic-nucleotide 2'-phosphodiesterase (5'-nucleotidase family)
MSRKFFGFLVLFSFLAAAPFLFSQPKVLTILHTNDTHSCLFPFGPQDSLGGIARMSTLIKQLKAKDTNVLTLHAGDAFVGTFEFNKYLGYPELKIMEGLYDAMELGNHEFDFGPDVLAGVLSGVIPGKSPVMLPVLCANLNTAALGLSGLVAPNLVKAVGEPGQSVQVGIFGVVNTAPQNYSPEFLPFLTDPIAAAQEQVAILQAAGCEVIVCLSHLGLAADTSTDALLGLASVDGIDIIVGGHSHDGLKDPVTEGDKIIVQGGYFGLSLGELEVEVKAPGDVKLSHYKLHQVDRKVKKDPSLLWTLNKLRVGLVQDPRFGPVLTKDVAKADWDMEKEFPEDQPTYRDSAVGDLVSDALRWGVEKAGYDVDVALEALGYIGSKIYKGKIVGNDVMRVVPYGYDETSGLGFKIVIVDLTGEQLWGGLEYSLLEVPASYDMAIQPSGLSYKYDSAGLPGGRLYEVMINGIGIDPSATYKVAINEQVYKVLLTLLPSLPKTDTGLFEYNVVRNYMKKLNHVGYEAEGRVIDEPPF